MVMIGGNSRNTGKTTMACTLINKLSVTHEIIGLKVTSIRPGEQGFHGNHEEESEMDTYIYEELNSESNKDTSKMLRAGAKRVYYIRLVPDSGEKPILHFLSRYINNQVIVCESRSLRNLVTPGFFLMMMKSPNDGTEKDVSAYISIADKVFYEGNDFVRVNEFASSLQFEKGKFKQI
jgi:hypothetical protein